jgi:hypothetical protein
MDIPFSPNNVACKLARLKPMVMPDLIIPQKPLLVEAQAAVF